jgi:hypothetical protein
LNLGFALEKLNMRWVLLYQKKVLPEAEKMQEENSPLGKYLIKKREAARVFEAIDDEIVLIGANARFSFATCKMNKNTLRLTLAYLEDTKKIVKILKERIKILSEATS